MSLRVFLLNCSECSICIEICCLFWYLIMITSKSTMAPRNIPPIRAFLAAMLGPARIASTPPVIAPEAILLYASSVFLKYISVHSEIEQMPAHMAKLPARIGALFFIIMMPPKVLSLFGEQQAPLRKCHAAPMRHPIEYPPPRSSTIRYGHGFYRIILLQIGLMLICKINSD